MSHSDPISSGFDLHDGSPASWHLLCQLSLQSPSFWFSVWCGHPGQSPHLPGPKYHFGHGSHGPSWVWLTQTTLAGATWPCRWMPYQGNEPTCTTGPPANAFVLFLQTRLGNVSCVAFRFQGTFKGTGLSCQQDSGLSWRLYPGW